MANKNETNYQYKKIDYSAEELENTIAYYISDIKDNFTGEENLSLIERIKNLDSQATTFSTNIGTNTDNISDLDSKIKTNTSNISDLDSKINATIESKAEWLDGRIRTNAGAINQLETDVRTLQNNSEQHKTKITQLTQNINTNKTNITGLEGRINGHASSIGEIQTTLKNINADNLNELVEDLQEIKNNILNKAYPVGSVYISLSDKSPAAMFGGTWTRIVDRFLLGGSSVSYEIGSTGGEAEHTLTVDEMPPHTHDMNSRAEYSTDGSKNALCVTLYGEQRSENTMYVAGGGQPHNNMPPYLAVYMWQRTA